MEAPSGRKPLRPPSPFRRLPSHVHDHFLPHEGNGFTPRALRHHALVGYSVAFILLKATVIALPLVLPQSSAFSSALTPDNIVSLVNENRRALALPLLRPESALARAAQRKAEDMARYGYFAHTSPSGTNALAFMRAEGYQPLFGGENLAVHFEEAEDADRGWMASPSHRANIVDPRFIETGVGVAQGEFEGIPTAFVVQLFGTPKPPSAGLPTEAAAAPALAVPPVPAAEAAPAAPVQPARVAGAKIVPAPVATLRPAADGKGYVVRAVADAQQVAVQTGTTVQPLAAATSSAGATAWTGRIAAADLTASGGEEVNLIAQGHDGTLTSVSIGRITASSDPRDLFVFRAPKLSMKLFGKITVSGLEDQARRVYVLAIVALSALLLLNVFVRIQIQRIPTIFHAAFVIGLAAFLALV